MQNNNYSTICPNGFSKGRIKKKWWNNGITEVLQVKCPIGFTEGRLPLSQEHKEKQVNLEKANTGGIMDLLMFFQQNVQINLNLEKYIIKNIKYTSNIEGKGMCRDTQYVDYLKRCVDWRLRHNK